MKQAIGGIKGLKPRAAAPKPDGKLSKQESHALDEEYRRQRNLALQLKNRREQCCRRRPAASWSRSDWSNSRALFLLIAMRRRAFTLPQVYCDRLAAASDPLEAKAILDEAMRGLLTEVADLPNSADAAEEAFLAGQEGAGEPVAKSGNQGTARKI